MADRVEIWETVENAIGLNITGATVVVKYHGGAQAPVYSAENGGSLLSQPLTTVNGKIDGYVAQGTYDLEVTFGGDTLVFFWPATKTPQFVTTLPAGVGTSAPEDAEFAIELYDSTNKGAWLRRYRAASSDWDMIGGPPPAGASLPGSPRARQEFYVTGGSPAVQHQRYNGSSWEYVGTPPMVAIPGSPLSVLETGQAGQLAAGRQLAVADFTTLAALPTTPVGLFNLSTLSGAGSNLGSGGNLSNKGTVTNGVGIEGTSNTAAQFTGSTSQALYIVDTGASDPFRIKTGSFGCWFKTAKRGTDQKLISKVNSAGTAPSYSLTVSTSNKVQAHCSTDGTTNNLVASGTTDVVDDKWHHAVATYGGGLLHLYIDGKLEASMQPGAPGPLAGSSGPFNIGAFGADGSTAAGQPMFGRVDEAFVTPDVLSLEQIRLLYAAKVAHGYSVQPVRFAANVRRRRRGAALVSADFPAQPKRLHNFTAGALTDLGSDNQTLTNNNTAVAVAGVDGGAGDAFSFVAASNQNLSATDTGLPSGTNSCSMGVWFRTSVATIFQALIGYGTAGTADHRLLVGNTGALSSNNGGDAFAGPFVADGEWHFVVMTADNSAADGVKRKLYVDGRVVGGSTVFNTVTLAGAGRFRIGRRQDDAADSASAIIDSAFVYAGALTPEQIWTIYNKAGQTLSQVPINAGEIVEAFDATNLYVVPPVPAHHQIDLAVSA